MTGNVKFMAEGLVIWQSRIQTSVALSTMQAEYMALAAKTQEAIWQKMVLQELVVEISSPIVI